MKVAIQCHEYGETVRTELGYSRFVFGIGGVLNIMVCVILMGYLCCQRCSTTEWRVMYSWCKILAQINQHRTHNTYLMCLGHSNYAERTLTNIDEVVYAHVFSRHNKLNFYCKACLILFLYKF